jgi:hypothetical protein
VCWTDSDDPNPWRAPRRAENIDGEVFSERIDCCQDKAAIECG